MNAKHDHFHPESPLVHPFLHPGSHSFSYVLVDGSSNAAIIVDPVLDTAGDNPADQMLEFIRSNRLLVSWILETHVHADHLTAAHYLRERLPGAQIACSSAVADLRQNRTATGTGASAVLGRGADRYLEDGDCLDLGHLRGHALATPGHTPTCMTFLFGDCAFVGDTLFMPDLGTARCDFPGGSAHTLYQSIARILALPDHTRLFLCHDYPPEGRDHQYQTTVGEQRAHNVHVKQTIAPCDFVGMRTARDATLAAPAMMERALPYNVGVLQRSKVRPHTNASRARPHSNRTGVNAH